MTVVVHEIDPTDRDLTQLVADGERYLPSDDLTLAVRVAQAIDRPLLLYGEPGSGKSTLARHIAVTGKLRYYEHVTTARTQPQDLLWSFDNIRRLGDAQADKLAADTSYVTPGPLWWAFRRNLALDYPASREPFRNWNAKYPEAPAVVLIDEIDKADPDLPNGLLVPLALRRFVVTDVDGGLEVTENATQRCLVVVTSNRERDLPQAFVRRCVVYRLPQHKKEDLTRIAESHLRHGDVTVAPGVLEHLLSELDTARKSAERDRRRPPSTAEFLDAVNACVQLGITSLVHGEEELKRVLGMLFTKDSGDSPFPG